MSELSPVLQISMHDVDDDYDEAWLNVQNVTKALERRGVGIYANLATLQARIPAPERGMHAFLLSPGYPVVNTAGTTTSWRPEGPRTRLQKARLTNNGTDLPLAGTVTTDGFDHRRFDESRPGEPYMVTVCLNALVAPTNPEYAGGVSFHLDTQIGSDKTTRERITSVEFNRTTQCQNATIEIDMPNGGDLTVFCNYINLTGVQPKLLASSRWSMSTRPLGLTY